MLRRLLLFTGFTLLIYVIALGLDTQLFFFNRYARWGIAIMYLSGMLNVWAAHYIFLENKFPGAGIPALTAIRLIPALVYFAIPYVLNLPVGKAFPAFFIIIYFIFMAFEIPLILTKLRPENKQPE